MGGFSRRTEIKLSMKVAFYTTADAPPTGGRKEQRAHASNQPITPDRPITGELRPARRRLDFV